jgi:hypothetical protein
MFIVTFYCKYIAALSFPNFSPDIKTGHLFENCEDGSLTAEDAELCSRRASAIKTIQRAAINQQLAKNPPVRICLSVSLSVSHVSSAPPSLNLNHEFARTHRSDDVRRGGQLLACISVD